jgi:hypothetical protein
MESGIIYVLNIGMKHIDTNLKDWICRYARLRVLEVVENSAKIHQFRKKSLKTLTMVQPWGTTPNVTKLQDIIFIYMYNKTFRIFFMTDLPKSILSIKLPVTASQGCSSFSWITQKCYIIWFGE